MYPEESSERDKGGESRVEDDAKGGKRKKKKKHKNGATQEKREDEKTVKAPQKVKKVTGGENEEMSQQGI